MRLQLQKVLKDGLLCRQVFWLQVRQNNNTRLTVTITYAWVYVVQMSWYMEKNACIYCMQPIRLNRDAET